MTKQSKKRLKRAKPTKVVLKGNTAPEAAEVRGLQIKSGLKAGAPHWIW